MAGENQIPGDWSWVPVDWGVPGAPVAPGTSPQLGYIPGLSPEPEQQPTQDYAPSTVDFHPDYNLTTQLQPPGVQVPPPAEPPPTPEQFGTAPPVGLTPGSSQSSSQGYRVSYVKPFNVNSKEAPPAMNDQGLQEIEQNQQKQQQAIQEQAQAQLKIDAANARKDMILAGQEPENATPEEKKQVGQINLDKTAAANDIEFKNQALQAADAKIAAASAAVQQADPGFSWHSRTNFGNAAGLIAAFMGGFMAPSQGGKNPILDTIMRAIDNDMKIQEQQIAESRAKVTDAAYAYSRRKGQLEDWLQDRNLGRAMRLDDVKKTLLAQAAGLESSKNQAAFLAGAAQVEAKSIEEKNKFRESQVNQQLASYNAARNAWYQRANIKLESERVSASVTQANAQKVAAQNEANAKAEEKAAQNRHVVPETRVSLVTDPTAPVQRNDAAVNEYDDRTKAQFDYKRKLQKLYNLASQMDTLVTRKGLSPDSKAYSEKRRAFDTLRAEATADFVKANFNRTSQAEIKLTDVRVIPDAETWFSQGPKAQLRRLVDDAKENQRTLADSLNLVDEKTGKPHDWDTEFHIAQDAGPGLGVTTMKRVDALSSVKFDKNIGQDTARGALLDAQDAVSAMTDNIHNYNPGQIKRLEGTLMQKAVEAKNVAPDLAAQFIQLHQALQDAQTTENTPEAPWYVRQLQGWHQ